MDCLTAQTKITSYVEGQLFGEELKEFLIHMEKCSGCKEELEIYYTLLEATRQLDDGVLTTNNFSLELEHKIKNELEKIREKEGWSDVARILFIMCIVLLAVWGVMNI